MSKTKKISDSEVLRLALEVVVSKGPDSFTLADVSKKVRLAPATLVQRFKSKEILLLEILKQDQLDFRAKLEKSQARWEAQGIDGIAQFLAEMSSGIDSDNIAEHIQLLAKDLSVPKLNQMARERMARVRKMLQQLLLAAEGKGALRTGLSIDESVQSLEALWHGSNIQWAFVKHGSLKTWVRARVTAFLYLLKKQD